jgi:hypothetical protein
VRPPPPSPTTSALPSLPLLYRAFFGGWWSCSHLAGVVDVVGCCCCFVWFGNGNGTETRLTGRCKTLLMGNQQKAGLAIMEVMASTQETAYEKLYRWTQTTCRGLTQASPDQPAVLARAMQALQNRSVLSPPPLVTPILAPAPTTNSPYAYVTDG